MKKKARVSARQIDKKKQEQQARDHDLISRGVVDPQSLFFLRPARLKGARLEWPETGLIDSNPQRSGSVHRKKKKVKNKRP
ncbi:MAG: hypothetical protein ACREUL_09055 [Steroidobacteraceae bacterium]